MVYVWSLFVRLLHWALVVAFVVAFCTRESEWTRLIHVYAGYTAGVLVLMRIVLGFVAKGYANFSTFPPSVTEGAKYVRDVVIGHAKRYIGHNPAGSLVIYGMLIIGLLTVASGWLVFNDAEFDFSFEYLSILHTIAAWSWLLLVVSHVMGVLVESFAHKENLIMTMITGYKRK